MLKRRLATGILLFALCLGTAFAQGGPATTRGRKFEVVSIRENLSEHSLGPGGVTPDGYRSAGMPLLFLFLTAYVPQSSDFRMYSPENILGAPPWVMGKTHDIDARVSDADRADWQDPKKQQAMLREMLQDMLQDRFKLVVHREMKEMPVYDLVVTKGGPKFQEAKPDEPHPDATPFPDDGGFMGHDPGRVMHFYDVPIKTITRMLSGVWAGRPVLDRTGLTGRYDIRLTQFLVGGASPATDSSAVSDSPTVFSALGDLGLKLEPAKGQVETLVIDHIEPPTAN